LGCIWYDFFARLETRQILVIFFWFDLSAVSRVNTRPEGEKRTQQRTSQPQTEEDNMQLASEPARVGKRDGNGHAGKLHSNFQAEICREAWMDHLSVYWGG
jgi:hypothetical protein